MGKVNLKGSADRRSIHTERFTVFPVLYNSTRSGNSPLTGTAVSLRANISLIAHGREAGVYRPRARRSRICFGLPNGSRVFANDEYLIVAIGRAR
jgi:hypothetical protein